MRSPLMIRMLLAWVLAGVPSALSAGTLPGRNLVLPAGRTTAAVHHGGVQVASAPGDTVVLLGPWSAGAAANGQFEDPAGEPAWNGWTPVDLTRSVVSHWAIRATPDRPDDPAAWCFDAGYPACDADDPDGGYGDNWRDMIEFRFTVAEPDSASLVTVQAALSHDLEPGFDFVGLAVWRADAFEPEVVRTWDGRGETMVAEQLVYLPGEYRPGGEIVLQFQVTTDEAYSDADCRYPSRGAAGLDDITVGVTNAGVFSERVTDFDDGTFGSWRIAYPVAVGNFGGVWPGLRDIDPCRENTTPQLAFIDDGQVVPGTGGSRCRTWCYGPGGYAVNTRGGLLGPAADLSNAALSPVLPWPDTGQDGCLLAFDWYLHELAGGASGPIYVRWAVRSTAGTRPWDINRAAWRDRGFSYVGGGAYQRFSDDVTDLLVAAPRFVQVRFLVFEPFGWWYGEGDDSTPAPYFDNVRLSAFRKQGPALAARTVDLAGDGFPSAGNLAAADPGGLSVRFDMGADIAPDLDLHTDPGDSIVVRLRTSRTGAVLTAPPTLHYNLLPNPAFDAWRSSGLPLRGAVPTQTPATAGTAFDGRIAFDLPDSGFLFPGDVLRYYVRATDALDGAAATSLLPADTTGFSAPVAGGPLAYDPVFTMRALPSLRFVDGVADSFAAPPVLFWNDDGSAAGWTRWAHTLDQQGLQVGRDYDVYQTRGAANGGGNGLGGRATVAQVAPYRVLLYTAGTLANFTLSDGDLFADPSDDLALLRGWLALGGRGLLLTGDNLAADLTVSGGDSAEFLHETMGVELVLDNLRPMVGNQAAPLVAALPGNGVLPDDARWVAYGGCEVLNRFDVVRPVNGALRLAEFLGPGGAGGYDYAAATLQVLPDGGSRVVSLPYDLQFVTTAPDPAKAAGPLTARSRLLADLLAFFGAGGVGGGAADVPGAAELRVAVHPNPFNPATAISYELPAPGRLVIAIYDLRGRLVRHLHAGPAAAGPGRVVWDGRGDGGATAPSGLYFYEVRCGNTVRTGKMTLLK